GVLQALRAEPATATIPFIFLTAKGEKLDQRVGMNLGADDYLVKPVGKEDLLAAISARLQRQQQHEENTQSQLSQVSFTPDLSSAAPLESLGLVCHGGKRKCCFGSPRARTTTRLASF